MDVDILTSFRRIVLSIKQIKYTTTKKKKGT